MSKGRVLEELFDKPIRLENGIVMDCITAESKPGKGLATWADVVTKGKDKEGHEHAGDSGQFTSTGGGSAKPKDKPGKKPAGKPDKPGSKPKPSASKETAAPPEEERSEKALRAKAAHVMVDSAIQRYSEERNEPVLAKHMGGVSFPDSEAVDVAVPRDPKHLKPWQAAADKYRADLEAFKAGEGKRPEKLIVKEPAAHGVELKTWSIGANAKLTMKGSAQKRKAEWEVERNATFHTVCYDDRAVYNANGDGKHGDEKDRVLYYRRGGGSFRIEGMYQAKDHDELKALMAMSDDQLPERAKPSPQWKQFQQNAQKGRKKPKKGK